jgi:hypothetical protein
MVLEVSVLGCLAPLLWVCGEAECDGGKDIVELNCSLHGGHRESRERAEGWGRGQGQGAPFKSRVTYFLYLGPSPNSLVCMNS